MMILNSDMVLISTTIAAGDAQIDFTGLSDTYDRYIVEIDNLVPSVVGPTNLIMRMGTGAGPTYQTGASDYSWVYQQNYTYNAGNGVVNGNDYDDSFIRLSPGITTGVGSSANFIINVFNPSQSSAYHGVGFSMSHFYPTGSETDNINGTGFYKATTPVTAIRFYMSSGNIASGTFKLYGII